MVPQPRRARRFQTIASTSRIIPATQSVYASDRTARTPQHAASDSANHEEAIQP